MPIGGRCDEYVLSIVRELESSPCTACLSWVEGSFVIAGIIGCKGRFIVIALVVKKNVRG